MNQGRVWCVVNPTVGLPLFLAGVALTSLAVHASVMTHTTWMSNYWQGSARRVAENATDPAVAKTAAKAADAPFTITVAPVAATPGRTETAFVITVAPNPAATAAAATAAGPVTANVSVAAVGTE